MTRFSTPDGLRTPILRLESELAQEQSPTLALISQPHPPLGLVSTVPADGMIIHFLFDTTSFISNFIIGPSIAEGMRTSLQTRFFVSPETQLAGFLAFASEYATRCGRLVLSAQTNMP
ncbi:hypothetical protein N7519_009199 [Penicillium mononematosum]|uniref:uncharacterized protein n=1 Tax=Penicillium mononematosum TaxID=268346 RepID=UPI0025467437|nr:uncharacterized protein N7519_009199 [Penicillium mononematosum]KAJ6178738.1 hypothetical protein N7519_009199 [Penicillium mononematosum]